MDKGLAYPTPAKNEQTTVKFFRLAKGCQATLLCILCYLCSLQAGHANESQAQEFGVSYGYGIDVAQWIQVDMLTPTQTPFQSVEQFFDDQSLKTFVDFALGMSLWETSSFRSYHFSSSLILRTQNFHTPVGSIFFEAAFGPQLISKPGKTSRLDTAFEFHSHLGLGFNLSPHWSVTSQIDHLSNGGITDGNAGLNAYMLQLHYRFDDKDEEHASASR